MASPRHILRMEEDLGGDMLSAVEDSNIRPFFADYPLYTNLGLYDTNDNDNEEEDNSATAEVLRETHRAHLKWRNNDIDLVLRRCVKLIYLSSFLQFQTKFTLLCIENETRSMPNGQGHGRNLYWIPYNKELMLWTRKIQS